MSVPGAPTCRYAQPHPAADPKGGHRRERRNTKDQPIAANDGSLRPHSRSSSGSPSRLGATKFAPDLSSVTTASGTELMVLPSRSAISNSRPATPSRMIGAARRGADQKRAHGTRHSCGTDRRKRGSLPEPNRPKSSDMLGKHTT
jgi:hypothetical protein